MWAIAVSELEFAHPGGDSLFFDVTSSVAPGEHAAVVGTNGSGKSTLLQVLAWELEADGGVWALGKEALYLPQDVGMRPHATYAGARRRPWATSCSAGRTRNVGSTAT